MAKVAVLGGGISGLTTAYYLSRTANSPISKIALIEGSKQFGGWMQSSRFDDGTVFEHGPRSFRGAKTSAGYASLLLAEEVGLEPKILPVKKEHPASTHRYLYAKNQLCALPKGPGDIMKKIPPFSKSLVAHGWKEPFRKGVKQEDESIHSFFSRRFGEEVATYALSAMFRGIYAGDTRQLSIKSCMGDLFDWEQKYGSIIKGALRAKKKKTEVPQSALVEKFRQEGWSLWSFQGGLQTFPETIAQKLGDKANVELHSGKPCSRIHFTPDNKVQITFNDGVETFDHLVSALPSIDLARLVSGQHSELAAHLNHIPMASVGVVNLQFEGNQLPLQGLGHLVPFSEDSKVLGVLYDSCTFPGHGTKEQTTRLSVMMGGAWFEELFGPADQCSDDVLVETALQEVRNQMGVKGNPIRVICRIAKRGIPQYVVGHSQTVDNIFQYTESQGLPVTLLGACYKGVSLNDCVLNARTAAEQLTDKFAQ